MCKLVTVLQLLLILNCKCAINPITNPNPVQVTYHVTIHLNNFIKELNLSLCSSINPWTHEDIWKCGGKAPCILNPSTKWRWVSCFNHFTPWTNNLWYPSDKGLDGLQSQSKHGIKEKNPCSYQKSNLSYQAQSQWFYWQRYPGSKVTNNFGLIPSYAFLYKFHLQHTNTMGLCFLVTERRLRFKEQTATLSQDC
jgi:hypothetical protein